MTYEHDVTEETAEKKAEVEGAGETGVVQILGRDNILAAEDLSRELVEVPEWGGHIYVRALTGTERDAYEDSLMQERVERRGRRQEVTRSLNLRYARAKLCALTIVDSEGNRLFSDNDVRELGNKSAAALNRAYEVASRLSGLSDEDLEDLTGNSDDDPSGGLSSD